MILSYRNSLLWFALSYPEISFQMYLYTHTDDFFKTINGSSIFMPPKATFCSLALSPTCCKSWGLFWALKKWSFSSWLHATCKRLQTIIKSIQQLKIPTFTGNSAVRNNVVIDGTSHSSKFLGKLYSLSSYEQIFAHPS